VSADVEIDGWLLSVGFGPGPSRQAARAALEQVQLTRPGKARMSQQKLERATAELNSRFSLHCSSPACTEAARRSGRQVLPAATKALCPHCGGSDNARAAQDLLASCAKAQVRRLLVVGGSPSVREELHAALGGALELRTVDGTERRTQDRARSDLEWADLILLWGATELDHKVSSLYTRPPEAQRKKLVQVARRGIAALLTAAIEHIRRKA
jgi:hypothetical protein